MRDFDVGAFNGLDGRRIEVIADGLTLWQGAQLAIDAGWESGGRDGRGGPMRRPISSEALRKRKHAEPSEGRVVEEVELHLGVQRREGFRSVSPGQAPQPWHGVSMPQGMRWCGRTALLQWPHQLRSEFLICD